MQVKRVTVSLLIKILGALPFNLRSRLGRIFGALFALFPTKDRTIAKLQMERFLKDQSASSKLSAVYQSVTQNLFESLNLGPFLAAPDKYMTCANWACVEKHLSKKQGGIFLSAHMANWDLLGAYVISKKVRLSTVGREARNETFQGILAKVRNGYGIKTIWRSDRSAIEEIKSDLAEGRWIAALIDQDTYVTSEFVPFFGSLAKTPSRLVALAKQLSVPIITIFAVRNGLNSYSVVLEEVDPYLDVTQTLACFNKRLEDLIKKYPTQWVWFHKRWRTRPDDQRLSSKAYLQYLQRLHQNNPQSETSSSGVQTVL